MYLHPVAKTAVPDRQNRHRTVCLFVEGQRPIQDEWRTMGYQGPKLRPFLLNDPNTAKGFFLGQIPCLAQGSFFLGVTIAEALLPFLDLT